MAPRRRVVRRVNQRNTIMTNLPSDPTKAALVFGGSRGIGAAIAQRLAREGYAVALTYASRADKAADVVASIEAEGGQAVALQADSADADAINSAVSDATTRFGPLHVAVINAGVYKGSPLEQFPVDMLDQLLSVNVRGVFLAIQAAASRMVSGGRIITIGSNTAVRGGVVGSSVYAMTKAAVATLVRELALDLAPRRITINNIQPGPIETDITSGFLDQLVERNPLRRVGKPDEVAALAAYLSGAEAGYVTGASLTMDGGYSI
jgi:3-oxoacyl-[acyl-carrier protein] reductase